LGKPGYALAEVVIEAKNPPVPTPPSKKPAWRRFADGVHEVLTQNNLPGVRLSDGINEAWSLDVPRSELENVIGRLSQTGYFRLAGNPNPGVNVTCRIDGRAMDKQWGHVPELDALMERVRNEGHLVSYVRPINEESHPPANARPVQFAADWPPAAPVSQGPAAGQGNWVAGQAALAPPDASPPGPVAQRQRIDVAMNRYPLPNQGQYSPQSPGRYPPAGQPRYPQSPSSMPQTQTNQPISGAPYRSTPASQYPAMNPGPNAPPPMQGAASPQPFPSVPARDPMGGDSPQLPSNDPPAGTTPYPATDAGTSNGSATPKPAASRWSPLGDKTKSWGQW
jgi:hypothetical protein